MDLGFVEKGEGGSFIESGATEPDGDDRDSEDDRTAGGGHHAEVSRDLHVHQGADSPERHQQREEEPADGHHPDEHAKVGEVCRTLPEVESEYRPRDELEEAECPECNAPSPSHLGATLAGESRRMPSTLATRPMTNSQ